MINKGKKKENKMNIQVKKKRTKILKLMIREEKKGILWKIEIVNLNIDKDVSSFVADT